MDQYQGHKIPPQNIEAEQCVLGGMIIDNQSISSVLELLEPDDFYREQHQKIFQAMIDLWKDGTAVDLVTLTNRLRERDELDSVGGAAYVANLIDSVPTVEAIMQHAEIIKDKSVKRFVIESATDIVTNAYRDDEDTEGLLAAYLRNAWEGMDRSGLGGSIKKAEISQDEWDSFLSVRRTPFASLNDEIMFFGKDLIIVGARAGMGKTSFVTDLLKHIAFVEERHVIYCGALMDEIRYRLRLVSSMSGVPFNDLGSSKKEYIERIREAKAVLKKGFFHDYIKPHVLDTVQLIAAIRRKKSELKDIGAVAIENVQELEWPEKFKSDKKELDTIINALYGLTSQIDAPVILSWQISRKAEEREDTRPTLADLKGTGGAEEKVNKVLLLWRPGYHPKAGNQLTNGSEKGEVIIAKGGPPKILPLEFHGGIYSWSEPTAADPE